MAEIKSESVADFIPESGGFCEVARRGGGDRQGRDLIEAGLSEPAGWRVLLWGLCLWRRVRGARSAEARQDLDGRSVIGGVDGSRQIDAGNVVLGSTAAMVRQCRIAAVPANATLLASAIGVRWRKSGVGEPLMPQEVSSQNEGRSGAGRGRMPSKTMAPPQNGQCSGWRGGTASRTSSATASGRSSNRRQSASLSAR